MNTNQLGDLVAAVARFSELKELVVIDASKGRDDWGGHMSAVAAALPSLSQLRCLKHLRLHRFGMCPYQSAVAVAVHLPAFSGLVSLDLHHLRPKSHEDGAAFAAATAQLPNLRELRLIKCTMGTEGSSILAKALADGVWPMLQVRDSMTSSMLQSPLTRQR